MFVQLVCKMGTGSEKKVKFLITQRRQSLAILLLLQENRRLCRTSHLIEEKGELSASRGGWAATASKLVNRIGVC